MTYVSCLCDAAFGWRSVGLDSDAASSLTSILKYSKSHSLLRLHRTNGARRLKLTLGVCSMRKTVRATYIARKSEYSTKHSMHDGDNRSGRKGRQASPWSGPWSAPCSKLRVATRFWGFRVGILKPFIKKIMEHQPGSSAALVSTLQISSFYE